MERVIILVGSTASGKTKAAIELAKKINGEIISADSMQIYKYMDIGTAKPDKEEMQGIKHYLIDEVYPDEEFSVAKYQELSLKYIKEIIDKGKTPIIAGGTGLYINSLIYNINFADTICDWDLRENLKREAEEKGNEYLFQKLQEIDPESASKLHVNDLKRIIRAIEVFSYTGETISHYQEVSRLNPPNYNFLLFGIIVDRAKLYQRIEKRVDIMIEKGLEKEVSRLIGMGYDRRLASMQGIGYKEIATYLNKEISYDEAIFIIKRNSRRYAKRQMTWFRKIENINWLGFEKPFIDEMLKNI